MPKNKYSVAHLLKLLLVLSVLCCLPGCQNTKDASSLYNAPTQVYEHPHIGAVLTLPEEWLILSEAEDNVVFTAPEGSLTLTMVWELGGYTYYSDSGLLDIAEAVAGQILQEPEILQRQSRTLPGNNQLLTATGPLQQTEGEVYDKAEGEPASAVCEIMLFSPLPALRYYVITVADVATYEQNSSLLKDIYASFYLNESEDVLYEGLHQEQPNIDDADTDDDADDAAEAESNKDA